MTLTGLLFATTGLLFATGCAEAPRGPFVGASDAWAEPRRASQSPPSQLTPESARAVSQVSDEVRHWPLANSTPFTSHGHQPEQSVDVRLNEVARASYEALVPDTVFPDGSALVQLAHGRSGPGYLMRKAHGSWSFFQLDARGVVLASGALALCAGCHAQAPADGVFGLPRGS